MNNTKQKAPGGQKQDIVNQETVSGNIAKDGESGTASSTSVTSASDTENEIITSKQTQRLNSEYDQKMAELEAREDAGETIDWEKEMDKMAEGLDKQFSDTETQLMSETIEE